MLSRFGRSALGWSFGLLAVAALAPAPVVAQQNGPAAVISFSPLDEMLADVEYVAKLAEAPPQQIGLVKALVGGYAEGVDRSKPWGAAVTIDPADFGPGSMPPTVVFVPTKDFDALLDTIKTNASEQLGEPEDLGDGAYRFAGGPQEVILKSAGEWALVATDLKHLEGFPADPAALLAGLDEQYDVAVRINIANIPEPLREMAIAQVKAGMAEGLEQGALADQSAEERETAERLARNAVKGVEDFLTQGDNVTVGFGIDATSRSTYFEVSAQALPGTEMAAQMATLEETTSAFGGFLLPGAAATMNVAATMSETDVAEAKPLVATMRAQAMKELENDASIEPEKREQIQEIMGGLLDLVEATLAEGKLDGGATLVLKPGALTFAAGAGIADGAKLAELAKALADLAKDEPDFPGIKFDAETHGGVVFHTLSIPIPDAEPQAQLIFGEALDVVIGTGPKSAYFVMGKSAASTLKEIIDASAAAGQVKTAPMQLNVALGPIVAFVESLGAPAELGPVKAALAKAAGKDQVLISSRPIERGSLTRIELQEGVLTTLGKAGAAMQGAAAPPDGF